MKLLSKLASGLALAGMAAGVAAAPVIFTGTSGSLSAEATFDVVGGQLIVTLRNTAADTPAGQDVSSEGLAAVFFDLPDAITLTEVSAAITAGQIIQGNTCDIVGGPDGDNAANCTAAQTDVGGEFAYATTALITGADRGISSSGYGIFGDGTFGGANLDNPDAVDGANFLLVSQNEVNFNPNAGFANDPLIQGTVTFTFTIAGGTLTNSDIGGVSFQYGTSLTEPGFPGGCINCPDVFVPEPSALLLIGSGLLGMAAIRRRRFGSDS